MIVLAASHGVQGALLGPVGFVVAIFVGMVSFFSPCVLPLLPGYLSFVSGLSGEELEGARRRVFVGTSLFVLGFTAMFTLLGVAANFVFDIFRSQLWIDRVTGIVLILMGLAFAVPSLIPSLERERRPLLSRAKPGLAGAFPLGLFFAAGWIPCVGPGLGAILSLTQGGSVLHASVLLVFFSLGFGVWFILGGVGLERVLTRSDWLRRHTRHLQVAGGVFMIAIGVLFVTNQWGTLIAPLRRMINRFSPPV